MKKLLLCFAWLALLPQLNFAQCGLFHDDFETGMLSSSYISAGGSYTRSIQSSGAAQGTYYMEQAGSGSHFTGAYFTFPSSTPSDLSFWVKTSTVSQHNAYFVVGDANIASSYGTLFFYIRSNGNLRFYANTSVDYNYPATANTWYHIEFKNMNYTTFTHDIWVNGVQVQTNFPFRNNTPTIDRVYLYNLGSATAGYDEITIGGNPVNLATSSSNINCAGDSTGTAMVTATGGTPNYSYLWSTGDTLDSLANLPAGTYTVMVTDSAGCMKTDSLTITEPAAISSTLSSTPVTCPGGSDGAATLSASGGSGSYSYAWSNGDTTQNISNAPQGSYTIVLTDSLGCTHSDSVSVGGPAPWNIAVTASDPNCAGSEDGSIVATVSGATPGYTYMWSTGDTVSALSGIFAGTYTLTIMDSLGCSTVDTTTLVDPLAIASSGVVADDTSSASTGAIDLTVTGGTPPFTFSWDNGATTEDLSGLTAGTYIVTVTDSNGCTHSDTFVVNTFVGIQNALNSPDMQVFPNPTTDQLQINIDQMPFGTLNLHLTDLRGKVIRHRTIAPTKQIRESLSLHNLPAGTYLLQVRGDSWQHTLRVIKQ